MNVVIYFKDGLDYRLTQRKAWDFDLILSLKWELLNFSRKMKEWDVVMA